MHSFIKIFEEQLSAVDRKKWLLFASTDAVPASWKGRTWVETNNTAWKWLKWKFK